MPSGGGGAPGGDGENPFAEEGEDGAEAGEAEAADPGIEETDPVEEPDEVDHDALPPTAAARINALAAQILQTNPEMGKHAFRLAVEVEAGLAASGVQRIAGNSHPFDQAPSPLTSWLMNQLHGHPQRGGHGYSGRTPAPYHHDGKAYIHAPGTQYHGMEIPWLSPHTSQGTLEDRYHARNKVDPFRSTRLSEAMDVHLDRLQRKVVDWADRKFNKPSEPHDEAPEPKEPEGPPEPTEDDKQAEPFKTWGDFAQHHIRQSGQDAARSYWHMRHSEDPMGDPMKPNPMPKGYFGGDPSSTSENEEPHYATVKRDPSATNAREDALDDAEDGGDDDSGGSDDA